MHRDAESDARGTRIQAAPLRDEDAEPMGGDPACWLHLFEEDEDDDVSQPEAATK